MHSCAPVRSETALSFCYRMPPQVVEGRQVSVGSRRFPPPWEIEDNGACFMVRDASGQALSYVYYEADPGRRTAAGLLTKDEARRIAANIAKIPEYRRGGISSSYAPTKSLDRRGSTSDRGQVSYVEL
jgi:hypothetical protein